MKILYMGTPEIARTVLSALIENGENVVAVVTREDKPRGRGNVMTPTPVRILAEENGIKVYTPSTLRDGAFENTLKEIDPDIIVVCAYGKILPKSVLEYGKYGAVNLHVSLLPKYRGSAPMQRAIMNGESETGVTIMQMNEGLDTGDIIAMEKFPITENDNLETIHDRSAEVGAALLLKVLSDIENGKAKFEKQDESEATYAPKIEKSELKIDFSLDAKTVSCRMRGVTPPGAYGFLNGKMLKLLEHTVISASGDAGCVLECDTKGVGYIDIACGEGALRVYTVVPEGKGRMSAGDFVRGRKINVGDKLT